MAVLKFAFGSRKNIKIDLLHATNSARTAERVLRLTAASSIFEARAKKLEKNHREIQRRNLFASLC